MDNGGGVSTGGVQPAQQQRAVTRRRSDKPYKGIRMRKWGKWVAEIREPNKRSRIWLGSYSTAVAAARAYDTAVYYLRGPTAKLNFPEEIAKAGVGLVRDSDLSAASIRKMAAEVGARVDALQTGQVDNQLDLLLHANHHNQSPTMKPSWFHDGIDLNKKPEPEPEPESDYSSTADYW